MNRRMIPALLLAACAATLLAAAEPDPRREKLCWAHYVGWGFNQAAGYDNAALNPAWQMHPFTDRSLLGRYIQCDSGLPEGARRQIECALAYGIDGFCVDVIFPNAFTDVLGRFYRAAEGTPFKIALCIDNLRGADLEKHLAEFLRRYGGHPNNCFIDGRPVVFVYNTGGKTAEEWRAIRANLEKQGLRAYYLAQPMRETTLWENEKTLETTLRGFDGFYDFGINGFFPEEIDRRLSNGKKALAKYRKSGILAAGITVGYLGQSTGFYRPFLNTGTLCANWESAIRSKADWVCLTTWNDYVEHTHFEPSAVNRDTLLRLNREYLRRWRGETPPARPAELLISYREELAAGDDFTVELLNFSYDGESAAAHLRLLDENGGELRAFPPRTLSREKLAAETLRMTDAELGSARVLRLQCALTTGGEKPQFRELHPVIRRPGRLESIRTVRIPFNTMSAVPVSLALSGVRVGKPCAKATLKSWAAAGKIELLRNGWPVAEAEVNHTGNPQCTIELPLPETPRSPEEVYIARYSNTSGGVSFSPPVFRQTAGAVPGSTRQPVIETGSDFDEGWPIWSRRISRYKAPKLVEREFPENDIFSLRYDFTEGAGTTLSSSSGWKLPALSGANHRRYCRIEAANTPAWHTAAGPEDKARPLLRFDGDDCVILPSRTMPYGPFTIEFLLRPEKKDGDGILFFDQNGHSLRLDAALRPVLKRLNNPELNAARPLPAGSWSHLAAVYDGKSLALYINGEKTAISPAAAERMSLNSVPAIGADLDRKNGFKGDLGGFALEGAARKPDEFKLLKQLHRTEVLP